MESRDALTASATISWPTLSLGGIERHCLSRAPDGFAASALEDPDGVLVTLFAPDRRQTGFLVSRLQLADAINPHGMLEVLTHEAVQKFLV